MNRIVSILLLSALIAAPALALDEAGRPSTRTVAGDALSETVRLPARLAEVRPLNKTRTIPTECPDSLDMLHYELHLEADHATEYLEGTAFLTFRSEKDGLASTRFDLRAMTVDSIFHGATPLAYLQVDDTLFVTLDAPLMTGDTAVVAIHYSGNPESEGPGGFGGFWFGVNPITDYSMGVGLNTDPPSMGRYWFPGVDQPCDKATCEIVATTNLVKSAVATGRLDTVIVDSVAETREWHWVHDYPVSTYLMAVAISKYDAVPDSHDARITYYVHRTLTHLAPGTFINVHHMMDCYESLFGTYPYVGDKFSYVVTPLGDMEHTTCVFHSSMLMTGDTTYDDILAHELTHMWFGDLVTYADWREVWLSEGFATYGEALWREYQYGTTNYHAYVTGSLMGPYLLNAHNLTYPIYDPDFLWGTISYEKGGVILHMLRHVMGDSLFFAGMNAFKDAHAFGNVTTPDFIAACEGVYGSDLDWFFDEWIYQGGHPVINWGWSFEETAPSTYRVDVETRQVQTVGPTAYTMPVDLRIETAGGDTIVVAMLDAVANSFSFVVDSEPTGVVFDPDNWLLDENSEVATDVAGPAPRLRYTLGQAQPNPFNPVTTIPFKLPIDERALIRVYTIDGKLVRTLVDGNLPAGEHTAVWDGTDRAGRPVASGVYLYRMQAGSFEDTRKAHLVR